MLRCFLEYQWFVDFAVYATAVYVFTEGYSCLVEPQREMNLGVLWCLLTVFFSMYPCSCYCHVILFLLVSHWNIIWGRRCINGWTNKALLLSCA